MKQFIILFLFIFFITTIKSHTIDCIEITEVDYVEDYVKDANAYTGYYFAPLDKFIHY